MAGWIAIFLYKLAVVVETTSMVRHGKAVYAMFRSRKPCEMPEMPLANPSRIPVPMCTGILVEQGQWHSILRRQKTHPMAGATNTKNMGTRISKGGSHLVL